MTSDPYLLVHAARAAELRDRAHRHALARLVTCCRPSALHRAVAEVRARWSRPACCTG